MSTDSPENKTDKPNSAASETVTKLETSEELIASDQFGLAELAPVDLYQKREKIYTRAIEGYFQKIRLFTGWPLLLAYFLSPWFEIDGRQALLFDMPARKFYVFWFTFWPQDFPLLAWLMIIAAFGLFAVTNFAGRVWCGYTCPQTVWTAVYMWAEQITEGSRNQRIKLDKQPLSFRKLTRKLTKHILWFGFAFLTGFTFIAYFTPAKTMFYEFFTASDALWVYAWVFFFTLATYLNAGYLREQVCMYMCPYARFQSAMFDSDTLIVSYDSKRGEPRGSRKRDESHRDRGKGDCIDCELCVQVCPTGIDIRDGLQYQCITCALCIDACDSVMDKMGYPRGLIRYTTETNLSGGKTKFLRPKLMGYAALMLVMSCLFLFTLATREPLRLDVIRDRADLYSLAENGSIENVYQLRVLNMAEQPREFQLSVSGLDDIIWIGPQSVALASGEAATYPIRLLVPAESFNTAVKEIEFQAESTDDRGVTATSESRFIGPTN
jgi:cytochrome c oxidase accessory protein FixG